MPLSICAPAKYADRLCKRLRCYMIPALLHDSPQGLYPDNGIISPDALVANYQTDRDIWATPHNSQGSNIPGHRRNLWHKNLDDVMFYL